MRICELCIRNCSGPFSWCSGFTPHTRFLECFPDWWQGTFEFTAGDELGFFVWLGQTSFRYTTLDF
jgi:hypothetical protein